MLDDRYIRARVEQTGGPRADALDAGVPIVTPPGSHAIFLDAPSASCPTSTRTSTRPSAWQAEIYVETGVRAMERG